MPSDRPTCAPLHVLRNGNIQDPRRAIASFLFRVVGAPRVLRSVTMSEKACTIRTRKFLTNPLLGRKQFVSLPSYERLVHLSSLLRCACGLDGCGASASCTPGPGSAVTA